ncbi:MAG TPA: hypothetical protein VJH04_02495 [archaeon]|nr:hypothetical protein [archaeon]
MEDKFLIRVDEEMPSDERTAIKIIETGVGHEINERVGLLLERVDTIAATNNIDILREMKDILSGLLESLSALGKRNSFISEMLLKMDDKIQNQEKVDLSYVEGKVTKLDSAMEQMTNGMAKILADVQVSIENLNTCLFSNTHITSRLEERVNEKFVELSVSNAELNDKNNEVLEKLQVIDAISADLDVKIMEIRSIIEENTTRLGEAINASHATNHDLIVGMNGKIDSVNIVNAQSMDKMNQRLDAAYMNDAELTQKINELYVNTNSLLANMESKLVQINSEINSRIQDLSVSNAELIERSRSLSLDMTTVSDKLNEKIGEMSVINAEIAENMRALLEKDVSGNEKLAGLQADITGVNEKLSTSYSDRAELMGRLDEIASGTAELIKGVEENVRNISEKNSQLASDLERVASNNSEMINRLEERMASIATGNMETIGRLEEKITDIQIDNKQNWSRVEDIISGNIATPEMLEVVGQRIVNLRDSIRGDITALSEEVKKLQKKPRARKVKKTSLRIRPSARPKKAKQTRATRQIEDEALDILIVNTLKNVSMTIDSLSRATNVSETRLRKRLTVLITRGVIAREKRGRSTFFASRVEEADN